MRTFAGTGWGQAKTASAKRGNLTLGCALGSGYQAYFVALTSGQQQAIIAQMKAAGISWIRMDAEWWTVQPTQNGGFDWSVPDATANIMLAAGMNLVILLNTSPVWARRAVNVSPLFSPWQTPNPTLYAAFCAAAATHYAAKGVHVFELWNEPNLDSGANTAAGWGPMSPWGCAELSLAAYPAIKAADPKSFVLSGSLATASEFGTAGVTKIASWSAITAGTTTAVITCGGAASTDANGFFTATGWPTGTIITTATTGVGYTVKPPPWMSSFPAINAGSSVSVQVSGPQYPPDVFLQQTYAYAASKPMFDALAIHPYTNPVLPAAQLPQFGGWATVPTLRALMQTNGDGAKPIWITEFGAPTGAAVATWSSLLSSGTSAAVTCSAAAAADLGYQFFGSGFPAGSYVSAVAAGSSWTVSPPPGIALVTGLTSGQAVTSLVAGPTPVALTIPSGTSLTVVVSLASTGSTRSFVVTTTSTVTTSTSSNTTIPITSATPAYSYPVGSLVRGSVGQTWGSAINAGTNAAVTLLAPGVASAFGMVDEATQANILSQGLKSLAYGVAAGSGLIGSAPWPYAGPVFVYTWGDAGGSAGPFGLTRADGTVKQAVSALTTAWLSG